MRVALFAVLLSIMRAAPPAPPQRSVDTTQRTTSGQKQTIKDKKPVHAPPSFSDSGVPQQSINDKLTANNPAIPGTDRTIRVRELPSVSVTKDWMDKTAFVFGAVLAIVGIVGITAAYKTLKAIEGQTSVLSESQRPRIVAVAGESPNQTLTDDLNARRIVLSITNKGQLPATDYKYESWIEVLPDRSGDFTADADHFRCEVTSVLYPDAPQKINIPLRQGITTEDLSLVRKAKKYVCVRLRVEYKDPFIANRQCHANFGFYVVHNGLGFLEKHNGVGYEDKKAL